MKKILLFIAIVLLVPVSGWCAITHVGTPVNKRVGSGDDTLSITVESDADLILVTTAGYYGGSGANDNVDELNFDNGADIVFTKIGHSCYSNCNSSRQIVSYYIHSDSADWPGSGAKTIYFSLTGTFTEGMQISAVQYKGVSSTGTIIDTDFTTTTTSQGYLNMSLTGVGANDLGVIIGGQYTAGADPSFDCEPTGYGQTEIVNLAKVQYGSICIGHETGENSLRVESTQNYLTSLAFGLKAAVASFNISRNGTDLSTISHINGVAIGNISHINGVAK